MNLENIKIIINSNIPDNDKEYLIITILSEDENVIPLMMEILEKERKLEKEISLDMNHLLSLSDAVSGNDKLTKSSDIKNKIFYFFYKYRDIKGIGHCYEKLDFSKVETNNNLK